MSAIGLYALLEYMLHKIRDREMRFLVSLLCIGAVAYLLFTPYFDNRGNLYRIIDDDTYTGLKALEKDRHPPSDSCEARNILCHLSCD